MENHTPPLHLLSQEEWENVCTKCGGCCVEKFDVGMGLIFFSDIMCMHYDEAEKHCSVYENRLEVSKGKCKKVDLNLLQKEAFLLPPTCAYKIKHKQENAN